MKRILIILTNLVTILGILLFVFLYNGREQEAMFRAQLEAFEDMTVAAEQATAHYLTAEQHLCDVWAHYINASTMTMEEAIDFVRSANINSYIDGQIIYIDDGTLAGLSTQGRTDQPGSNTVSYARLELFPHLRDLGEAGERLYLTRGFVNPLSGVRSVAFYNPIHLTDETGAARSAILLRIIPLEVVKRQWVFPNESYERAEFALVDGDGNYLIKGPSFKDANFLEYYSAYNPSTPASLRVVRSQLTGNAGSMEMNNSQGERCVLAHAPVKTDENWAILTTIPLSDLNQAQTDWLLLGVVAAALVFLLLFDLGAMLRLNRKLQSAAQTADAASRAKTDFLSTMSHDIRTPMNAIVGLTTIAEKNVEDPEAVRQHLRRIGLASNHLLTLINDILDISKVERGKLNLSPVTFSIVESVENLVNLSQPMVKEKSIDFSFRVNPMEREYLYADQLRLNQIFINILSNAIKYTEPFGSVRVDLRMEPGEEPGRVKLTYIVADTGIGMSPEFMARMYQPFSRQTDSRVNTIQGTGLGLAITKQMVDLMEGTIDCQSEQGKGTVFTVVLDLPAADRQTENMTLEPVDVLVADNDPVQCRTARDILTALGVRAETATAGSQAVELTVGRHSQGSDYAVVILDGRMADVDGLEAVRRIRARIQGDRPLLLISAYEWSDIEEAAREAGADGFVGKPFFRSTLCRKLSELLGREGDALRQEDDDTDIQGMTILVAEDNDMNWEVIDTLLDMHGVHAERVENGRLAVETMAEPSSHRYDLIFMDIQMPVMNGLDATRAIRALPDSRAASIPIIAMTADAFSENITECLEAGMNGHIAKPVDIKLVLKEIRRIRAASV